MSFQDRSTRHLAVVLAAAVAAVAVVAAVTAVAPAGLFLAVKRCRLARNWLPGKERIAIADSERPNIEQIESVPLAQRVSDQIKLTENVRDYLCLLVWLAKRNFRSVRA